MTQPNILDQLQDTAMAELRRRGVSEQGIEAAAEHLAETPEHFAHLVEPDPTDEDGDGRLICMIWAPGFTSERCDWEWEPEYPSFEERQALTVRAGCDMVERLMERRPA